MQTFTDLYKYRCVLSTLASKNLKVLFRNMSLGLLWSLLSPLVMVVMLSLVWTFMFATDDKTITAKIIVALILYNFCVYCLTGCASSIHGSAALVKKVGFPRQILPSDEILTVGDAEFQAKCERTMREFIEKCTTLFFVSHDLDAVTSIRSRAIWIDDGKMMAIGDAQGVVDLYPSPE